MSSILCGKTTKEIIDKLEIIIKNSLSCWRNLRLSTKTVKIHGIEDHLLNQMMKYNKFGYFIEYFIEQTHQLGMIDERRTLNMRDWVKASIDHSEIVRISWNSKVKLKIQQLAVDTRKTRKKRNLKDIKSDKKKKEN